MRIIASVYVDHQGEIGYPISYVVQNLEFCDAIYLFGSDAENVGLMEEIKRSQPFDGKIRVVEIGLKVNVPDDIARAQDACFVWMKENDRFDYAIANQADIALTERGRERIWETVGRLAPLSRVLPVMMRIQHCKLHCDTYRTPYGCALLRRDAEGARFVGDGAYPEEFWESITPDPLYDAIEVGWIGIDQYARHLGAHARTWPDSRKEELLGYYRTNRTMFAFEALRTIRYEETCRPLKLMDPANPDYAAAVTHLGLAEERKIIENIILQGNGRGRLDQ